MATTKHAISEHDVVVLRAPVAYDDTVLVEIIGPGGKTLDTIQVPAVHLALKQRSDVP